MGYQLIETIEVGAGGAASIEFTGIPQDGVSLVVALSLRTNGVPYVSNIVLDINDYATSASKKTLYGTGSSVSSSSTANAPWTSGAGSTASTFGSTNFYLSNYSGSTAKSISADGVFENNATAAFQAIVAGLWNSTSAITGLRFTMENGTAWVQHSTASIYKITAD